MQRNSILMLCVLLILAPIISSFFSFVNNIVGYHETVAKIVYPLISMQTVAQEKYHMYRAMDSYTLAVIFYIIIALAEFMVAMIGLFAIYKCIKAKDLNIQVDSIFLMQVACIWGVIIWGIAFFSVGGDFFLSWKSPVLGHMQADALRYMMLMFIVCFSLDILKKRLENC